MKLKLNHFFIVLAIVGILFQDQLMTITNIQILTYSDEVFILIIVLIAGIKILKEKKTNKITIRLIIGIIIFSFFGILSAYINSSFNLNHILASNLLAIKFFLVLVAFLIIDIKAETINFLIKCMKVIANSAVFVAIINMLAPNFYLKFFPWGFIKARFGIISPTSIFEHPGTYGWFLILVAGFYYSKYMKSKEKKDILYVFLYAFFAILSMKAKVILSLATTILAVNIFSSKHKINFKKIFVSILGACVIIIFSYDFLKETFIKYFTFQDGMSARSALNINSLSIMVDYFPLGVGFGKFGSHYARIFYSEYYYNYNMTNVYGMRPENPMYATDTFWPSILGETGILGISVYMICMFFIFKQLRNKLRNTTVSILPLWAMAIFIQGLIESLGAPTFYSAPQNILIGIIIAIGLKSKDVNALETL